MLMLQQRTDPRVAIASVGHTLAVPSVAQVALLSDISGHVNHRSGVSVINCFFSVGVGNISCIVTVFGLHNHRAFQGQFNVVKRHSILLVSKNPHNTAVDVALRAGPSATGVASAHHLSVI